MIIDVSNSLEPTRVFTASELREMSLDGSTRKHWVRFFEQNDPRMSFAYNLAKENRLDAVETLELAMLAGLSIRGDHYGD